MQYKIINTMLSIVKWISGKTTAVLLRAFLRAGKEDSSKNKKELLFMVKIRLARHGAKKRPYYRIVVADARCPRDGKFIDDIGRYNPLTEPAMIKIDLEKCDKWLANGAQPTDTVAALIKKFREQA